MNQDDFLTEKNSITQEQILEHKIQQLSQISMQNYLKLDQIGGTSQYSSTNEDLILSRNSGSLQKRLKSNSLTQSKIKNLTKPLHLKQQINDSIYPKTTRNYTSKNSNNLNSSMLFNGKHQSLHLQQSPQNASSSINHYQLTNQQLNSQQNSNESKLFSLSNQIKPNYQSHGLLSPCSQSNNQQFNLSFMVANTEEVQQMKATLQNIIWREEDIFRILQHRSNKLSDIISLFGTPESFHFAKQNDFTKFREAVQDLSLTLVNAAKNEIELGAKSREMEKLTLENKHLQCKHCTLKEKCQEQQKVNDLLSQRNKQLLEENNKFLILLNTEKKDNRINTKKVSALEKRVEFILENEVNVTLNPNDKLRQSLNELLRENESLKRDLAHKNQEIERNIGNIKRMNDIINRLNSKIESMKRDPSKYFDSTGPTSQNNQKQELKSSKEASETNYVPGNTKLVKNDDIDLFSNFVIPSSLDFRIVSMKSDHQNIILDLIEVGNVNYNLNLHSYRKELFRKRQFLI